MITNSCKILNDLENNLQTGHKISCKCTYKTPIHFQQHALVFRFHFFQQYTHVYTLTSRKIINKKPHTKSLEKKTNKKTLSLE